MILDPDNPWRLPLRVFLVSVLAVLVQEALVGEISIFGVNADVTPLVVMTVGMMCGSLPGAITGFFVGLCVDMALGQTLGLTSLLYIPIGYWCGRFMELRAPEHALIPLGMGAAATLAAALGMAVIQFLLGVDAPVSGLLFQQIFMTVLINTLIALPVYHAVRRMLRGVMPTNARKTRRGYTGGVISPLQQPSERLRSGARIRG